MLIDLIMHIVRCECPPTVVFFECLFKFHRIFRHFAIKRNIEPERGFALLFHKASYVATAPCTRCYVPHLFQRYRGNRCCSVAKGEVNLDSQSCYSAIVQLNADFEFSKIVWIYTNASKGQQKLTNAPRSQIFSCSHSF